MIVCHCKVVTDATVAEAVVDGACTMRQVCAATGAGRDCGGCVFSLKRLLCEHGPDTVPPVLPEVASEAS